MKLSHSSNIYCILCTKKHLLVSCQKCSSSFAVELPSPPAHVNGSSESNKSNDATESVIACCISAAEKYVAAATSSKRIVLWSLPEDHSHDWSVVKTWELVKRPVDLIFDKQVDCLLVADKTGDVIQLYLPHTSQSKQLDNAACTSVSRTKESDLDSDDISSSALLGHLSMLLSLTTTVCGRLLLTADRDERIRVSHYPRAHNIQSFCLGHTEFVSQMTVLPSTPSILLSASGDGCLKLWNILDGSAIFSEDTSKQSQMYSQTSCSRSGVAMLTESLDSSKIGPSNEANNGSNDSKVDSGRDRVVPSQPAIVSLSVTPSRQSNEEDLVAVSFDRSSSLVIYSTVVSQLDRKVSPSLRHLSTVELSSPATTVCWFGEQILVAVCAPSTHTQEGNISEQENLCGASDDVNIKLWQWTDETLLPVSNHHLLQFCSTQASLLKDIPRMDTNILYKERYDNVAEYKKKKMERIQHQEEKRSKQSNPTKKIKLTEN